MKRVYRFEAPTIIELSDSTGLLENSGKLSTLLDIVVECDVQRGSPMIPHVDPGEPDEVEVSSVSIEGWTEIGDVNSTYLWRIRPPKKHQQWILSDSDIDLITGEIYRRLDKGDWGFDS